MTDSTLAVTPSPTAVAVLMEAAHIAHQLVAYRGALTPRLLDAPETEIAALTQSAALHDLGWMRRVAVRGEDRFRWLSGMVTNTVNDLFPNTGAWNLVLNAQGRIQGDLTVWREGEELSPVRRKPVPAAAANAESEKLNQSDARLRGTPFAGESGLMLEIANDQLEKLLAHFNRFIIMDDVELVPLVGEPVAEPGSETAIGLSGPLADEVLERVGLPTIASPMAGKVVEWNGWYVTIVRGYGVIAKHYEFWLPTAGLTKLWSCLRTGGAVPVGCESVEKLRIAEGIPTYGIDMVEKDLPQETSQTRALHYNKGCYLGQEIVERIHSRGNVHRHLRPMELAGPVPDSGAELKLQDGTVVGYITSAAELPLPGGKRVFALGTIRGEAEASNQSFNYTSGVATGTAQILAEPPEL
ncbi:MAG TPA: folate-binding protein [Terracidiphilus sp.]|nr:folate-binding protein [Terracidiphilus sp.]